MADKQRNKQNTTNEQQTKHEQARTVCIETTPWNMTHQHHEMRPLLRTVNNAKGRISTGSNKLCASLRPESFDWGPSSVLHDSHYERTHCSKCWFISFTISLFLLTSYIRHLPLVVMCVRVCVCVCVCVCMFVSFVICCDIVTTLRHD